MVVVVRWCSCPTWTPSHVSRGLYMALWYYLCMYTHVDSSMCVFSFGRVRGEAWVVFYRARWPPATPVSLLVCVWWCVEVSQLFIFTLSLWVICRSTSGLFSLWICEPKPALLCCSLSGHTKLQKAENRCCQGELMVGWVTSHHAVHDWLESLAKGCL